MRGGIQKSTCPTYIDHLRNNDTSDFRCSDEAIESTSWKCRENVQDHVAQRLASIQCEFCNNFADFYLPGTKFIRKSDGHYIPAPKFYSMSHNIFITPGDKRETQDARVLSNKPMTLELHSSETQNNPPLSFPHPTSSIFHYFIDTNNPRSQQEVLLDDRLSDANFLLGEGIPKKIVSYFDTLSNRINIKGSLTNFIFKNTNVMRYRLFKQLTSTQNLKDVYYRQFSSFIKDFIAIFVTKCTNSFLQNCIDNDIIPKKYRKNITLEPRQRTKTIRKDCVNLSKHIMENDITLGTDNVRALNAKIRGYLWELCCRMDATAKGALYLTLLNLRNTCAFVCGVGHTRKINSLVQGSPHICITVDNVLDVAIKRDRAYVENCNVQHFQHLYWTYREHTIEDFRADLLPLESEGGG